MYRFTIRDVLWLMVVVALGISMYQDRAQLAQRNSEVARLEGQLRELDFKNGRLIETVAKQKRALQLQGLAGE